jgi:hypothetical protein
MKEGYRNTAYFHIAANERRRKTLVHSLETPTGHVTDQEGMLGIAIDFYKNLFSKEDRNGFSLATDFFDSYDLVIEGETEMLEAPFT